MTTKQINKILKEIGKDISGRYGIGDVWNSIEDDIRRDIIESWRNIIKQELEKHETK